MAKKKVSNAQAEKPLQKQEEDTVKAHQPAMDSVASDKIDNLKSLNQMLLKEAVERRQQISSLEQSKGQLESEVSRLNTERDGMRLELIRLAESLARMEVEKAVMADFVSVQVNLYGWDVGRKIEGLEMEMSALRGEIGRLNGELSKAEGVLESEREVSREIALEKDGLEKELGLQIEDIKRLEGELDKSGDVKRGLDLRIEELGNAYDALGQERKDLKMRVESITREKDSVLRSLEEANKLNGDLQEEIQRVVKEKENLEKEKTAEKAKKNSLESDVSALNEKVASLEKEEEKLRSNVANLEKQCCEGEERLEDLRREIDELVKEKKLNEKKLKLSIEHKVAIEKDLEEARKQLDEQKHTIDELDDEKGVILEGKVQLEGEVATLKDQVAKLKNVVLTLEEERLVEVGQIKKLESEVKECRCKLDEAKAENIEWENRARVGKEKVAALEGKICGLEDKVKESGEIAKQTQAKNAAILSEKSKLASECGVLKEKVTTLEIALVETRNELDSTKTWAETANVKSGQAMSMLKDAVAFCVKDADTFEDGNKSSTELEMIKRAFKSRESKVEKMVSQLEELQSSLKSTRNQKGFFTALSCATTILAAAMSIAFAARGRV